MQLRGKKFWLLLSVTGISLILGFVLVRSEHEDSTSQSRERSVEVKFPLPPIAESLFKNTDLRVKYVGSDACTSCHEKETESFRQTGMGISTALVDPNKEPPDGEFTHTKSRHRYQVFRKDGQLWHRAIDLSRNNSVTEYPVKYVIGSGINARTYAIEDKGFMAESPLTWYAKPNKWGLSPGYDEPQNRGFEREIKMGCLFCHAGQSAAIDNSMQRFHIQEAAISCERCHGPGELHVTAQTASASSPDIDYTIVNPTHLDRDHAEAICQQCHLHIEATVPIRNRNVSDFRPGRLLSDYRQDYQFEAAGQTMNVVGHVEQMHLSKCYIKTETLTCTSCHNPHQFPKPEERVEYYRNACIQCHEEIACKVDHTERQQKSPENDCVKCHMPTAKTEVQHVAFTHHRIGIHAEDAPDTNSVETDLTAWNPNSNLSSIDQELNLGLAYAQLAKLKPDQAATYNVKAVRLLTGVHDAGIKDPALEAALAMFALENRRPEARGFADQALESKHIKPDDRCVSLFVAAATRLGSNNPNDPLPFLQELVKSRRSAIDWAMLSEIEQRLGNSEESKKALAEAYRINPGAKK